MFGAEDRKAFLLIPRGTMQVRGDTIKKRPDFKHPTNCPHVQPQKPQVTHNCDRGSEMLWNKAQTWTDVQFWLRESNGQVEKAFTLSVLVVRLPSRTGNIAESQQFLSQTKKLKLFREAIKLYHNPSTTPTPSPTCWESRISSTSYNSHLLYIAPADRGQEATGQNSWSAFD